MDCPFCDNNEVKYRLIYRDNLVMAFPSNTPIVPGHVLVCPVRHVEKIDELSGEELMAIKNLIIKLKSSLKKIFEAEGFNMAFNEGYIAGQSVEHLHVHILPRKTGDSGVYKYEPREFLYWRDLINESSEQKLHEDAEIIKKGIE